MPKYKRCRTCGRYVAAESAYRELFCSRPCAYLYRPCSTCGRYYRASAHGGATVCSAACAVRYRLVGRTAVAVGDSTALPT